MCRAVRAKTERSLLLRAAVSLMSLHSKQVCQCKPTLKSADISKRACRVVTPALHSALTITCEIRQLESCEGLTY